MLTYFASGDGPFYFSEQMKSLSWFPPIWESFKGFGENLLPRLWIDYPFRFVTKMLFQLGFSWWVIEKLFWIVAIALALYSSYTLGRKFSGKALSLVSSLIYLTNTYALLLFGGGQLGIALAYAFSPFVLFRSIQSIDARIDSLVQKKRYISGVREAILNGLLISLLVIFDLRIAYIVIGAIVLYFGFCLVIHWRELQKLKIITLSSSIVYPVVWAVVIIGIHAFWILPVVIIGGGSIGLSEDFTGAGMLKFLSVADFSHALSLLHPNWPENLFGKVYFLQPEFLVLPIVAYTWVLFSHKNARQKVYAAFFGVLVIVGAFLTKGANEPFGGIYVWMFNHLPGFVMFRDPTKFYIFVALGYSILIPLTLQRLNKKFIYILFLIFWLFSIRQIFLGQLSGNFQPRSIPKEYITLKNILVNDSQPSRTLWLPSQEKFAFSSDTHPALPGSILFKNASISGIIDIAAGSQFQHAIYSAGVKYIVIPIDIEKRMFLNNYIYDPHQREDLILSVSNSGLERIGSFRDLAVYINPSFRFESQKPAVVVKQEYWSRVGLLITGVWLLLVCGVLVFIQKRQR